MDDMLSCPILEGTPEENSVPSYPVLVDARDESGRSYKYFRCRLEPLLDPLELTEPWLVGLSGMTLSRISDSRASSESISLAIF